jgi:hypothetical protein
MAKTRWDKKIFDANGNPTIDLGPEGWFAYCVKLAGGIPSLAEKMGVSRQTIYASWSGRFPDSRVVEAEKQFGIPRKLLAPHLYE